MKKFFVIIGAFIIISAVLFFVFKFRKEKFLEKEEEIPPIEVSGCIVSKGEIKVSIEGIGIVSPERNVLFKSPVKTNVLKFYIFSGKRVRKDEILFKLNNEKEKAEYEDANIELQKCKKKYEFIIVREEIDSTLAKKVSGYLDAVERFENARRIYEATEPKAPFDGFIGDVYVREGVIVDVGDKICEIYDNKKIIVSEIPFIEGENLKTGNFVEIRKSDSDSIFKGVITGIAPILNEKNRIVKLFIKSEYDFPLGSILKLKIIKEIYKDKIRIPNDAILMREGRFLVFKVEQGKAKWVWIDIGIKGDEWTEVLSGVNLGDTVLTEGHFTIAHDAKVQVKIE